MPSDDAIIDACEEARRLHAACQEGMARLAAMEMDGLAAPEVMTAAYWHSGLAARYEDRALRIQDCLACGCRGLIAKGEQLAILLDYKQESLDGDLLRAVQLYIADVRRVVGTRLSGSGAGLRALPQTD